MQRRPALIRSSWVEAALGAAAPKRSPPRHQSDQACQRPRNDARREQQQAVGFAAKGDDRPRLDALFARPRAFASHQKRVGLRFFANTKGPVVAACRDEVLSEPTLHRNATLRAHTKPERRASPVG